MTLPKEEQAVSRAVKALEAIQESAIANGTSEMTLEEINAEISDTRKNIANRRKR